MNMEKLKVIFEEEKIYFEGPEEKINLAEIIFGSINEAMVHGCPDTFDVLENQLATLLHNKILEEIILILKKYGATSDESISDALIHDTCIKEIVSQVNEIEEINTDILS